MNREEIAKRFAGKICPYCKTGFSEEDEVVVCSICDMPHHLSCWEENNGCTTFGCTGVILDISGSTEGDSAKTLSLINSSGSDFEDYYAVNAAANDSCNSDVSNNENLSAFLIRGDSSNIAERIRLAESQVKQEQEGKNAEIRKYEEKIKRKAKAKKTLRAFVISVIILVAIGAAGYFYGYPLYRYYQATEMLNNGEYDKAYSEFQALHGFKDSDEMMDECKYQKACDTLKKGLYTTAISFFSELKNYRNSSELINECKYQQACAFLQNGRYKDAVSRFEEIIFYKNSKDKSNEAKYGYVKGHKNNDDLTTYEYLLDLYWAGYKDASDIYNSLYSWKISVTACNTKKSDNTTISKSISKYCKYFHWDFSVSGGTPGEKISIMYKVLWPNAEITSNDNDPWRNLEDGSKFTLYTDSGFYAYPQYGWTGTMWVFIYDADTGALMNNFSVNITN